MHTPRQNKKVQRSRLLETSDDVGGRRRCWRSCSLSAPAPVLVSIYVLSPCIEPIEPIVVVDVAPFIRYERGSSVSSVRLRLYSSLVDVTTRARFFCPLLSSPDSSVINKAKKKHGDHLSPPPPPGYRSPPLGRRERSCGFRSSFALIFIPFLFLAVERIPLGDR